MGRVSEYGIGLDIGTDSIGMAAVDANADLLRLKGKRAISVYLYHEGEAAADRRLARTTRRRIKRAKRRLLLLREFFEPEIAKLDPEFFIRMKNSAVSPQDDKHTQYQKGLFNDRTDQAFYDQYPTIYHLRYKLMTEHRQFDVREIYLAIHHIMKHRGHFLTPGAAANFDPQHLDIQGDLLRLQSAFETIMPFEEPLTFEQVDVKALEAVLLNGHRSRPDRKREALRLLLDAQPDAKAAKPVLTEMLNAMLGLSTKVNVLVALEVDDAQDWKLSFDTSDDLLETQGSQLDEDQIAIVETLQEMYRGILLAGIMPDGKGFSESKVADYTQHCHDLKLFKEFLDTLPDVKTKREVRGLYDQYIDGAFEKAVLPADDFYKKLQNTLKKYSGELADQLNARIASGNFMPKQRDKANGVIPNQVQQQEMDRIIANQATYYPWLAAPNSVVAHRAWAPYQLDELLTFRLPYYNGPAITAEDQKQSSGAAFAWMVRKPGQNAAITPWNYDQQVDRKATAEQFIKRMQTTDTYLLGESVLPKQSLLYQKFEVLNELNVIRVDRHPLTRVQKQGIYEHVFRRRKNVRVSAVQDYLVNSGAFASRPQIDGLAENNRFLSSLSTYHDLKPIFGESIFDADKLPDIERIIEWATIFEDSQILREKLDEISWLTGEQKKALSHKRYRGWGQLSARLLTNMKLSNGRTIIDEMWETQTNLMRVMADDGLKKAIETANDGQLTPDTVEDMLDAAYTSPSNKKAIRKVVRIVEDIQKANGGVAPRWVFIETADGPSRNPRRTNARGRQLQSMYEKAASIVSKEVAAELQQKIKARADFNTRLFLYFTQGGIDLYTGNRLNIDELSSYDIDHIIPQSVTKDDSLANRVLVSSTANRRDKAERFASEVFGPKQRPLWQRLTDAGLISKEKFANLMMTREDFDKRARGFIARQLVETRQIIKLTEQILSVFYPETQIVAVKAGLTQQFRTEFDLPKNRAINDYHHGFDALLTAWVGMYLLNQYPKLTEFFVYGDYSKADYKKLRQLNFIRTLKEHQGAVLNSEGEILWGGPSALEALRAVYMYKHITTVHEVYERSDQLFKQTVFPHDSKKKLIPKKVDQPTELYGGYTSEQVAYMAIARVTDPKEDYYQVLNVPVRKVQWLTQQKQAGSEEAALHELFSDAISKPFRIILSRVYIDTLFWDVGRGYYMLASQSIFHNYQQLWLPKTDQELLSTEGKIEDQTAENQQLDQVYAHISSQMRDYFSLFDNRQFRQKFIEGEEQFVEYAVGDMAQTVAMKRDILIRALNGLHANAGYTKLPEVGIPSDFGRLMLSGGIKLPLGTQVIYQSPSGLFERRVELDQL